jgi:hypothetical protein
MKYLIAFCIALIAAAYVALVIGGAIGAAHLSEIYIASWAPFVVMPAYIAFVVILTIGICS